MSTIASVLSSCPDMQVGLFSAFNKYAGIFEPLPQLEFINSEANRSNLTNMIFRQRGSKLIDVDVTHFQRFLESSVETNQPNPVCTGGELEGDIVTTYTLDSTQNVQRKGQIKLTDLTRHCTDNPQFFADYIARLADVVERKVATKSATESVALIGEYASNVSTTGKNLVVSTKFTDNTQDPSFIGDIRLAMMKTGYISSGVVFADSLLYRAYMDALVGCCTDSGIDVSATIQQYGINTIYDKRVEAAMAANGTFGANTSMAGQLGSLVMLYYTSSGWSDGMPAEWNIGSTYANRTIIGRTGLPMDLNISDNCGDVTITVTATTKVVALPDDMYAAGDDYEGVNGLNSIKVTNP